MIVIDGRIGSGKSFVAKYLSTKLSLPLLELDLIVKELYQQDDIAKQVCKILEIDAIDFSLMRKIIFIDQVKRIKLQNYIYPILKEKAGNNRDVIIDGYNALTIFDNYDLGLIVLAPTNVRKQRVVKRGSDEETFLLINNQQREIFLTGAHTYCVDNSIDDIKPLEEQINSIMEMYERNREDC